MKTMTGKVVSDKMQHTVVVEVVRFATHPKYHKRMRKTKKYHAHTESLVKTGSRVRLVEIAPVSRTKHWKVAEVVEEGK